MQTERRRGGEWTSRGVRPGTSDSTERERLDSLTDILLANSFNCVAYNQTTTQIIQDINTENEIVWLLKHENNPNRNKRSGRR